MLRRKLAGPASTLWLSGHPQTLPYHIFFEEGGNNVICKCHILLLVKSPYLLPFSWRLAEGDPSQIHFHQKSQSRKNFPSSCLLQPKEYWNVAAGADCAPAPTSVSVRGGAQAGVGAGALVGLAKVHCTSTAFLAAHQIFSNEIISNNKSNLISMENKKLSWSNINTFSLFFTHLVFPVST